MEISIKEAKRQLKRIFKQTYVVRVCEDQCFDLSDKDPITVGFVHCSDGYYPTSCLAFSSYQGKDAVLQSAFEDLENEQEENLTKEEWKEREESIENGFDMLTEGWDGYAFQITVQDLREVIEEYKEENLYQDLLSEIEFYDSEKEGE